MADIPKRVLVVIGDIEYSWSIDEARGIMRQILDGIEATKVTCPTCRCRILPNTVCACCAEPLDSEATECV